MSQETRISGHTRLICLLGSPVEHSLSPAMHNTAFRLTGQDYCYLAFDQKEAQLPETVETLQRLHSRGFNLTMPLKTAMVPLCDRLSPAAEIGGTVNTVVLEEDGSISGHTTDGIGFTESARRNGVSFEGKKVTLLGTGGAGIAILVQLGLEGAGAISVFERAESRFRPRTQSVVEKLRAHCGTEIQIHDYSEALLRREIAESCLLVNATSIGMNPRPEGCILPDASYLPEKSGLTVSDVIYEPRKTRLLAMAEEKGLPCFNGLTMLLYQGAAAFRLWTGEEMPVEEIRKRYFSD